LFAVLMLLPAGLALGQTAPAFEVASIKPSKAEPGSGSAINSGIGRISTRNVTLTRCIRGAYDVPEAQIFGGPKWVAEDRYDIDAKAPSRADDRDLMMMLRTLLAERFQLVFHRETRPLNGYALIVAKPALLPKPSAPDTPWNSNASRNSLDATGCSMEHLAQKLAEVLHVPVADATGVAGVFDFQLTWTPEDLKANAPSAAVPGVTIFDTLQEHFGLKLEPRKVPTNVVVIDNAVKASEN